MAIRHCGLLPLIPLCCSQAARQPAEGDASDSEQPLGCPCEHLAAGGHIRVDGQQVRAAEQQVVHRRQLPVKPAAPTHARGSPMQIAKSVVSVKIHRRLSALHDLLKTGEPT